MCNGEAMPKTRKGWIYLVRRNAFIFKNYILPAVMAAAVTILTTAVLYVLGFSVVQSYLETNIDNQRMMENNIKIASYIEAGAVTVRHLEPSELREALKSLFYGSKNDNFYDRISKKLNEEEKNKIRNICMLRLKESVN